MKIFKLSSRLLMGSLVAFSLVIGLSSCQDDDPPPSLEAETTIYIKADETWAGDQIHYLDHRTIVTYGATLTIGAGAIIKGKPGIEADAKPLIIAKGAKIMAQGTAAKPIIFTAETDDIQVGQIAGSNLTADDRGLWAGIIILGNAPISPKSGSTDRIEGVPASITEGEFGGSIPTDNSGILQYISVRHAGVELVPGGGNEINGITLGGVGSGTTMDHIEIIANKDDGIEWFGGTVDVSSALVAFQGDDAFDVDQAYAGTISNVAYIAAADSDHGIEIDGPEGVYQDSFMLNGGKFLGHTTSGEYADFRSNAKGLVQNLYFWGFGATADVELDNNGVSANYHAGDLTMMNCVFNTPAGVTLDNVSSDRATTPPAGFNFDTEFANDNNSIGTIAPSGFDKTQFTGWTWADNKGLLTNF